MTDAVTFGSLFSGAGGFDLGLEKATWNGIGMTCKFQVEWDKHCQQVLQYHWADVPKWEDVQQVNGADLPPVDVIAWGSPCQDLSLAGKRAGLDGEKSSMFFEGIRIIKEMRKATNGKYPTVSIWENVAGAITSNNGSDFETVIREMGDTGCHHIEWRVLDSQWFGIPQRRRRIFVVAVWNNPVSIRSGQQILGVRTNNQKTGEVFEDVWRNKQRRANEHCSDETKDNNRTDCIGARTNQQQPILIDTHFRTDDVRVYHGGVAPTLAANATNRTNVVMVVSNNELRHLTEIECERLMGWNDDHTRFRADGKETASPQRYKMCGNGVAAPVATWIGERVIEAIRTDKELEQ